MTIRAIETRYAGCRFRSRLEAKWAVFFTALGIRWQYEPQGILVSNRLDNDWETRRAYLPDFLLPDHGLWVEVKGHVTKAELWTVLNNAASLSSNNDGGCHDAGGYDMLLLGDVPRQDLNLRLPARLHMHKGILQAFPWKGEPYSNKRGTCHSPFGVDIASDGGTMEDGLEDWLLDGLPVPSIPANVGLALRRAREARFEYGETPSP